MPQTKFVLGKALAQGLLPIVIVNKVDRADSRSEEVINEIFESALGQTVSYEADNGDRYWAQSSNQIIPSTEELGETVSRYEEFYNSLLNQQLNGFLDHTMKQGQKVRLQNFTAVN